MYKIIVAGTILKRHGLDGAFLIKEHIDFVFAINSNAVFYVPGCGILNILSAKSTTKNMAIIHLQNADEYNDIINKPILMYREDCYAEQDVYIFDIIGMTALLQSDNSLKPHGIVTKLLNCGAGDIIEILRYGAQKSEIYHMNQVVLDKIDIKFGTLVFTQSQTYLIAP